MFLTEYDEKAHMRATYKEGYEEGELAGYRKGEETGYRRGEETGYRKGEETGYRRGEYELLERQIRKKLERGKSAAVIAEELEEEAGVIEEMIENIKPLS